MQKPKAEKTYTAILSEGPGDGKTVELGYRPLVSIVKYPENKGDWTLYHLYMRVKKSLVYKHIEGCCSRRTNPGTNQSGWGRKDLKK